MTTHIKSAVCIISKWYIPDDLFTWVDHYLNYCGFDHIFLYDNCTQCMNVTEAFKNNSRVTITSVTDDYINEHPQIDIYHECMEANRANYDYIFFCDSDELLWYNQEKYSNINEFLQYLKDSNILHYSIPWRCISYNSEKRPYDRTRNFKDECTYLTNDCGKQSCIVKSFISTKLEPYFMNPHVINNKGINENVKYETQFGELLHPEFAESFFIFEECDLILYHYYIRSEHEFDIKMNHSKRIDFGKKLGYKESYTDTYIKYLEKLKQEFTIQYNPFKAFKSVSV